MTAITPTSHSRRNTLLLLAAVFVLPFVVGSGLFWLDWRPEKYINHGDLLQPPILLPETGLSHADGRPLPASDFRGKWLLVLPVNGACDKDCEKSLQLMQQVHIALNKEQDRLLRVLVSIDSSGTHSSPALLKLQQHFPDIVVAMAKASAKVNVWRSLLGDSGQKIFIVDPLGNVMMRYAEPIDMRGVLKDLERLLKYSWVR